MQNNTAHLLFPGFAKRLPWWCVYDFFKTAQQALTESALGPRSAAASRHRLMWRSSRYYTSNYRTERLLTQGSVVRGEVTGGRRRTTVTTFPQTEPARTVARRPVACLTGDNHEPKVHRLQKRRRPAPPRHPGGGEPAVWGRRAPDKQPNGGEWCRGSRGGGGAER